MCKHSKQYEFYYYLECFLLLIWNAITFGLHVTKVVRSFCEQPNYIHRLDMLAE